jgi:hypothetical protein
VKGSVLTHKWEDCCVLQGLGNFRGEGLQKSRKGSHTADFNEQDLMTANEMQGLRHHANSQNTPDTTVELHTWSLLLFLRDGIVTSGRGP